MSLSLAADPQPACALPPAQARGSSQLGGGVVCCLVRGDHEPVPGAYLSSAASLPPACAYPSALELAFVGDSPVHRPSALAHASAHGLDHASVRGHLGRLLVLLHSVLVLAAVVSLRQDQDGRHNEAEAQNHTRNERVHGQRDVVEEVRFELERIIRSDGFLLASPEEGEAPRRRGDVGEEGAVARQAIKVSS